MMTETGKYTLDNIQIILYTICIDYIIIGDNNGGKIL